jgi:hypothetical protein
MPKSYKIFLKEILPSSNAIFYSDEEGMTDMKVAGDIGRRDDHDETLAVGQGSGFFEIGMEEFFGYPPGVPVRFDGFRVIGFGHFGDVSFVFEEGVEVRGFSVF